MSREVLARLVFRLVLVGSLIFLFLPVAVMILFSFNVDRFPSLPWKGFTLAWYAELLRDQALNEALWRSLIVASISASVSVAFGFTAAYAFRHWSGPRANSVLGFIFLPVFLPYFMLGMASAVYFGTLGIGGHLGAVILIHVVICAPIAFAVIRIRLEEIGRDVEEAAINLGADSLRVIWEVMLPNSIMALVGGFLLAFTFSWDEFLIAWFLSGFDNTLPVVIWSMVRSTISPKINAAGALVFATSVILVSVGYFVAVSPARRTPSPPAVIEGP